MIKDSIRNDLCLLILLPANDAARKYCNQIESSSMCQIQMNSDHVQKGLVYTCIKQQSTRMKMNSIKSEHDIKNNNSSISKLSLLNSLKNLTIGKRNDPISRDLIKQRRVKINKKLLSSSSTSPIKDSNIPHVFNLWYNKKKKNVAYEQNNVIK